MDVTAIGRIFVTINVVYVGIGAWLYNCWKWYVYFIMTSLHT